MVWASGLVGVSTLLLSLCCASVHLCICVSVFLRQNEVATMMAGDWHRARLFGFGFGWLSGPVPTAEE